MYYVVMVIKPVFNENQNHNYLNILLEKLYYRFS